MKIAVLDLGSQTFHLAVYGLTAASRIERLARRKEAVRIGSGSTLAHGLIDAEHWDCGLAAVGRLMAFAHAHGAKLVLAVATSAIREAANGAAFCRDLERHHGVTVDLVGGNEEAALAYLGACSVLPATAETIAVVDLGGGSLELAVGRGSRCLATWSLPVGALRLRHRLVPADGYVSERTAGELEATVHAALAAVSPELAPFAPATVLLTSGTARAVVALANELGSGNGAVPQVTLSDLRRLTTILSKFRPTDLSSLGVEESRIDTVATAAVILRTVLDNLGWSRALVVDRGFREGVALRALSVLGEASRPGPARPSAGS